jgi:hypothetical protein
MMAFQVSVWYRGGRMFAIQELFEAHLTVANLHRAMEFYGAVLGLKLATTFPERRVAF